MLIYLIKTVACMAILFFFYKLFLERESMHVFKRVYLLFVLGFSLIVPALVFTEYVEVAPAPEITFSENQPILVTEGPIGIPEALEADVLDIEPLLWGIYFIGLTFFAIKFVKNLWQISGRIRKNPKQKASSFTNVLLKEIIPPHTFFNYIFLNKKKFESHEIPKEVILHEQTHAQQKHSIDVVLVEFLHVLFWFNPFLYLLKKSVKLNHEFLADQAVLKNNIDKTTYQNTLLSYLSLDSEKKYQPMANAINYSSIKKRFTIMKTHTSKKSILLRSILLLPLLAVLLYGFSETKTIQKDTILGHEMIESNEVVVNSSEQKRPTKEELTTYNKLSKKYNAIPKENRNISTAELKILETVYQKMSADQKENAQPFPECPQQDKPQDGASRKLMSEYNKLAKHYNDMPSNKMKIYKKDVERLEYIYGLMSKKQKANAEPFPDFPEPPAPPKAPRSPNEREEAAATIKKIIEEQDPYDFNSNGMQVSLKNAPASPIAPVWPDEIPSKASLNYYRPSPVVMKGEVSDIPAPPRPNREEMEEVMELKEELEIREQEVLLQKEEAKSVAQEILMMKEEVKKEQQEILLEQQEVKLEKIEEEMQRAQQIKEEVQPNILEPPVPPTPKSPLDYVIEMAKKNAKFYYKGKEISSDAAINLMKKNKDINIDSRSSNGKRPTVKLSTEPIMIEN